MNDKVIFSSLSDATTPFETQKKNLFIDNNRD